jgi:hypothetical protein
MNTRRNKVNEEKDVGGWLHLAATPTFAAMAALTVLAGNPADILCSAHDMSPLDGMTMMYLLMAAFHAGPWLKRVAQWRAGRNRGETCSRLD